MIRVTTLIAIVVIAGLAALAGFWLWSLDGYVEIDLPGSDPVNFKLGLIIILGLILAGGVAVAWWLLTSLVAMPCPESSPRHSTND